MLRRPSTTRFLLGVGIAAIVASACGSSPGTSTGSTDVGQGSLTGAGATFPGPFYTKAFADYSARYPQVTVNYQAVGSGAGIQQFIKKTVDFGASDVPMGSSDITSAGGTDALTQIPTTLGVISIAFNVSGVSDLNLDADTLAGIFLGQINKWNDPKLTALNSGTTLPNKSITVVHRSDGSGTTFHFTDYLSKVSATWKTSVGNAKSIKWPTGVGASGNTGVAQAIQSTDGAVGYVELAYVVPTNFSITNAACDACYPIAGFSWVMLYTSYSEASKGKAVVNLFKWLVTDGQSDSTDLQYAPLPSAVQQLALSNLKTIKAGGSTVLS